MTDPDLKVWSDMLAHLRNCHPAIVRQWFEELEPCGVAGGTMQLRAQTALHRDYLRRECTDPFGDAARTATGRLLSVRFLGPEDSVLPKPPPPKRATLLVDPVREAERAREEERALAHQHQALHAAQAAQIKPVPNAARGEDVSHKQDAGVDAHQAGAHKDVGQDGYAAADDGKPGRSSEGVDNGLASSEAVRIAWAGSGPHTTGLPGKPGVGQGKHPASQASEIQVQASDCGPPPGDGTKGVQLASGSERPGADSGRELPMREGEQDTQVAQDGVSEILGGERKRAKGGTGDELGDPRPPGAGAGGRSGSLEPRVLLEPVRILEPKRGNSSRVTSPTPPARYESLVVNPDYCFENFVVGPGNRMAHAAAQAIATTPGRVYNPFFVHAGVGLGKTHLLQAICLRIAQSHPNAVMYYTSCEGFVTQFFDSVKEGEMNEFRHRFRDVDVLVIDDIHFLGRRESSQEEFFHTFNALYQMNKQIILSCDAAPEEIPDLEVRLVSRFKWGLVTRIEQPIFETRVSILKTKAQIRGLELPDDVACFIAGKINTNIRELEGAIVKLHIQSSVEQRPIDMDLAREALGDSFPQPKGEPTLQAIITAVTEFFGVRLTDLQSKGRQRSIALPRQVCMFLARRCTRHSLEEIGGFFGGRDHTTVMHAVETVETKRKADAEFDLVLRSLEDRVRTNKVA